MKIAFIHSVQLVNAMHKIVSYSPLRISFGGGGTDISPFDETHGGAVINTTIDRGVTVSYTDDDYSLEISSRDFVRSFLVGVGNHEGMNVQEKILDLFEHNGIRKGRIVINSDVPPGSGLGSSSALTTAVLKLIYAIRKENRTPEEIAAEAFVTERDEFGVTLGKQDPYAVSLGGFKFMRFNGTGVSNYPITGHDEFRKALQGRTLLVYTGKTRESSDVLKDQVSKSSQGDANTLKNLTSLRDLAINMKDAVDSDDIDRFISYINDGWEMKKGLGRNVTNPQINSIIQKAKQNGAQGAKLMGGGSQGFVLMIAKENGLEKLQKAMMELSEFVIRVSFDPAGTRILNQ